MGSMSHLRRRMFDSEIGTMSTALSAKHLFTWNGSIKVSPNTCGMAREHI